MYIKCKVNILEFQKQVLTQLKFESRPDMRRACKAGSLMCPMCFSNYLIIVQLISASKYFYRRHVFHILHWKKVFVLSFIEYENKIMLFASDRLSDGDGYAIRAALTRKGKDKQKKLILLDFKDMLEHERLRKLYLL